MSDLTAEFIMDNIEPDSVSLSKASLKTQFATISDIQQGQNYSSGLVSYNNVQLQSVEDGCLFDLTNSLVNVQMTYTLTAGNATFLSAGGNAFPNNINAVTKKSDSHFIHNAWCKLGGVSVDNNNGQGYLNLYINEKKKERNPNLSYLENDLENFVLDDSRSFEYDNVGLESNNFGNAAGGLYNTAIWERNGYYYDVAYSNISNFVNQASMSQYFYPYFQNATAANPNVLQWFDVLNIPLSEINQLYGNLPPQLRLNGMEVKIQFNAGSAVSYSVTLPAGQTIVQSETVSIGNGGTFPLMLSSFENQASSALRYTVTNAANPVTFTLTCQIGWSSNVSPTRILIPFYKMSESALTKLTSQKIYTFPVRHCEIDTTITSVTGNGSVNKTLNTHYRSIRKLYIMPVFSNLNKNANNVNIIYPYQNARSSCPNTVAPLRLKQFNVLLGGKTVFSQENLNTSTQFYNEQFYRLNAQDWSYGNERRNPLKSGGIKRQDFFTCYNVFQVDLNLYDNEAEDKTLKSVALNFQMDGNANYLYDFFILIECEKDYCSDCIEGTIQDLSLVTQG